MADLFRQYEHALPTEVAEQEGLTGAEFEEVWARLRGLLPFNSYSAVFYDDFEYTAGLKDAKNPIEVLYYRGALDLLSSRSVSVVGARKASEAGLRRARKLARLLVDNGFTVMSGLAEGIDTASHHAALEAGGSTIAVLGTPLSEVYPKSNREFQDRLAREQLIVTQVPFYLASQRDYRENRIFFPERNKTMSALSLGTVIVEASETSGTLFQARAALAQGRRLFILNSCFEQGFEWPERFARRGAIRVVDGSEIVEALAPIRR